MSAQRDDRSEHGSPAQLPRAVPFGRSGRGTWLALTIGLQLHGCASGLRYTPSTPLTASAQQHAVIGSHKLQALLARFVRQQTDTSCSVAATSTVLGAVLLQRGRPAPSQAAVVATDATGTWQSSTANGQAPGVTLHRLALYAMQAFYHHGVKSIAIDVVQVTGTDIDNQATLMHHLEKSGRLPNNHFLIINFRQSVYLKDGEDLGHMSVIGAYDAGSAQALVLDVDNRFLEPYWVPLSVLLAGMNTADDETGEPRGYLVIRTA